MIIKSSSVVSWSTVAGYGHDERFWAWRIYAPTIGTHGLPALGLAMSKKPLIPAAGEYHSRGFSFLHLEHFKILSISVTTPFEVHVYFTFFQLCSQVSCFNLNNRIRSLSCGVIKYPDGGLSDSINRFIVEIISDNFYLQPRCLRI